MPISATASITELYAQVQQFYARQVHHLDERRVEPFAATFTEDGVFAHTPLEPPARGRRGIAAAVREFNERRFADSPAVRRHWFNMLAVDPQADGTVHTMFYALIITTRPGEQPVVAPSCTVRDVLVLENGELLLRSRLVEHDQLVRNH